MNTNTITPKEAHEAALKKLKDWKISRANSEERKEMVERYDLLLKIRDKKL